MSKEITAPTSAGRTCRILVLGSARPRIAKVMSLLLPMMQQQNSNTEKEYVSIEFLPCVVSFDSYKDEQGKTIRYLMSVNYHGMDGTQAQGSSLAPFFDEEAQQQQNDHNGDADNEAPNTTEKLTLPKKSRKNLGILGVAVGAGIEEEEDVERIRAFFQTLRGNTTTATTDDDSLSMKTIQPNPEFSSMKEETEHFKNMSAEAKEEVARDHSIGPGKMALFVQNYANDLVQEVLCTEREERERVERAIHQQQEQELESKMQRQQQLEQQSAKELLSRQMDTSKPRYACRKCRTIVFGEDDMEDPRHVPQQHKFSNRKQHHGGMGSADACQSYFLTDQGLAWMGDMSAVEGRLGCPKCKTKLGTWHWAGAQFALVEHGYHQLSKFQRASLIYYRHKILMAKGMTCRLERLSANF